MIIVSTNAGGHFFFFRKSTLGTRTNLRPRTFIYVRILQPRPKQVKHDDVFSTALKIGSLFFF